MGEPAPKRGVNPVIKVYAFAHMFLILSWSLPPPAPAISNGGIAPTPLNVARNFSDFLLKWNNDFKFNTPFQYYLSSTGLWQYWDMFAPNPSNTDIWYDAIVTFANGQTRIIGYPRMKTLNNWEKYFKERYRKYIERVNTDATDAWKRPAFAQRMALIAYRQTGDMPVQVQLRRHWRMMDGMDKPVPQDYKEFIFFTYLVDQDQVLRDAK
ncbi:MAG: hypothetical protein JSS66_16660 [Armatimonadetes bacterium]|nr:hypothetical protein [Armatimonadota bacterium]